MLNKKKHDFFFVIVQIYCICTTPIIINCCKEEQLSIFTSVKSYIMAILAYLIGPF